MSDLTSALCLEIADSIRRFRPTLSSRYPGLNPHLKGEAREQSRGHLVHSWYPFDEDNMAPNVIWES